MMSVVSDLGNFKYITQGKNGQITGLVEEHVHLYLVFRESNEFPMHNINSI